jgi:hypothetical protein
MSIITSKQQKRHNLLDPIVVLFFATLILLMFFAVFTGNLENTWNSWLVTFDDAPTNLSANSTPSFAADQRYWESNCSHGWSSDSTCENIELRSQTCVNSINSVYCSEYESYLQNFAK